MSKSILAFIDRMNSRRTRDTALLNLLAEMDQLSSPLGKSPRTAAVAKFTIDALTPFVGKLHEAIREDDTKVLALTHAHSTDRSELNEDYLSEMRKHTARIHECTELRREITELKRRLREHEDSSLSNL